MIPINIDCINPSLPTDKLLLLVRDNITYTRRFGYTDGHFHKLFGHGNLKIEKIKDLCPGDKLYVFDKEEQIAESRNSNRCLDKFLYNIYDDKNELLVKEVERLLKDGFFVGHTREAKEKRRAKITDGGLSTIDTNGVVQNPINPLAIKTHLYSNFCYTKEEYEFWKWFMS